VLSRGGLRFISIARPVNNNNPYGPFTKASGAFDYLMTVPACNLGSGQSELYNYRSATRSLQSFSPNHIDFDIDVIPNLTSIEGDRERATGDEEGER
jgi:hypothetical protein